jgi:hypothetical protein
VGGRNLGPEGFRAGLRLCHHPGPDRGLHGAGLAVREPAASTDHHAHPAHRRLRGLWPAVDAERREQPGPGLLRLGQLRAQSTGHRGLAERPVPPHSRHEHQPVQSNRPCAAHRHGHEKLDLARGICESTESKREKRHGCHAGRRIDSFPPDSYDQFLHHSGHPAHRHRLGRGRRKPSPHGRGRGGRSAYQHLPDPAGHPGGLHPLRRPDRPPAADGAPTAAWPPP